MARPFTVVNCEQRSAAWFQSRCGLLTASEAHILYAKARKGAEESVQRRDLRVRLALEKITGQATEGEDINSADIRRGRELEPEARATYEAVTGNLTDTVGFLASTALSIGCSPDGIVGDYAGGLELKAPKPAIFLGYLKAPDTLLREYQEQVWHSLLVTGLPWWDLAAYCPAFPEGQRLLVVRTLARDPDLYSYELQVRTFLNEVETEADLIRRLLAERAEVAA